MPDAGALMDAYALLAPPSPPPLVLARADTSGRMLSITSKSKSIWSMATRSLRAWFCFAPVRNACKDRDKQSDSYSESGMCTCAWVTCEPEQTTYSSFAWRIRTLQLLLVDKQRP